MDQPRAHQGQQMDHEAGSGRAVKTPASEPIPAHDEHVPPTTATARTSGNRHPLRLLLTLVGVIVIFTTGLGAGLIVDQLFLQPAPATADDNELGLPAIIGEAWDLVHERYVEPDKIDEQRMAAAAIAGMLETLGDDGHTRYLPLDEVSHHDETLSGNYVGVGIQVESRDDQVVVVAPIDGSPAQQAGIRAGDILVNVDGEPLTGLSLDEVVQRVRGPEGSVVSLLFERPGQETPIAVQLQRTKIQLRSVEWIMLPGQVADIRINQFIRGTSDQLQAALRAAEAAGATGIVLDLRNNPGGLVDEAMGVAAAFLPPDTPVFRSRLRDGSEVIHRTQASQTSSDLPLVVLVNEGSASAAEIVSGALQENHRATVVGERTFGTGTVLSQYTLSDGSALLLGTELWLTPNGQQIKGEGIRPNYEIAQTPDAPIFVPHPGASEEPPIEQDAQLTAALKVLQGESPLSLPEGIPGCLTCR